MAFQQAPRLRGSGPLTAETVAKHAAAVERAQQSGAVSEKEVHSTLRQTPVAKYKIEVTFGGKRTVQGPNPVVIKFWESGGALHGGGDELMYICRDGLSEKQPPPGCGAIFAGKHVVSSPGGMVGICPKCQQTINAERLGRDYAARASTRVLSRFLANLWRQLDCNADIYLKFQPGDIRYVAAKGDGVTQFRRGQVPAIYSLDRILEDTSVGSSVEDRFYAFLTA